MYRSRQVQKCYTILLRQAIRTTVVPSMHMLVCIFSRCITLHRRATDVCVDAVSSPGASAGLQSLNAAGSRGALFHRSRSLTPPSSSPSVTGAAQTPVAGKKQTDIKALCYELHCQESEQSLLAVPPCVQAISSKAGAPTPMTGAQQVYMKSPSILSAAALSSTGKPQHKPCQN